MTGNSHFRLTNTALVGVELVEAPEVVTSDQLDEWLAPAYQRLRLNPGMIEHLSGVRERRWWPSGYDYVEGAVAAGRKVIDSTGVDPDRIGLIINASVTRPHLEPALASQVHHKLGLRSDCITFDITNACLAVVNSIQVAGAMIDSGQIEYALVVASEGIRQLYEETIERLLTDDATRDDVRYAFATFTLGCGATGMLLGPASEGGHRIVGGVTRSGSEHHELCVASMHGMHTDGRALFVEGIRLAIDTWNDAHTAEDDAARFDWREMNAYVAHQTSVSHIERLCEALDLPLEKFPLSLPLFGNIAPVALPFTLAQHKDDYRSGDRILLMGIGSGLNTAFVEVDW